MSIDFDAIKSRHRLSDVVSKIVKLTRDGAEHRGLCPFHNEKTPSFTVVDARRFYHCFGCGARGDVIDFVRDAYSVDLSTALKMLEGETTREYTAPKEIARAATIYEKLRSGAATPTVPVPGKRLRVYNPKRERWTTFYPKLVHPYWARDRVTLLGCVVRIDLDEPGKKVTPTLRWATIDGEDAWCIWPFAKPRPLYVLPAKAEGRVDQVLIVEGEKAADAAARLLPMMHVATWAGGTQNARHADWTRLRGRSLLLWPDADSVGVATMIEIASLMKADARAIKLITWDKDRAEGWDAADAEAEGWSTETVIKFLRSRATVFTSPADASPASSNAATTEEAPTGDVNPPAKPARASSQSGGDAHEPPPPDASPPPSSFEEDAPPADVDELPFRILGHDNGRYAYFPNGSQQVAFLSASAHTISNLLALYPNVAWWEQNFPQKAKGFDVSAATAFLLDVGHRRGIFDDDRIRGRGAWIDGKQTIIHLGDRAIVDGEDAGLTSIRNWYIYAARSKLAIESVKPATTPEAHKLVEICAKPTWASPLSGSLLAGWIVTSMVCGALRWRPHVWVTGGAGSGKTTVLNEIIMRLVGPLVERCDGTVTEAAIRQHMKHDARPVVIDEFESEGRTDSERVQAVLKLIRLSSSGSSLKRGSANGEGIEYIVRSSFCLSSINTATSERADQSRISKLILNASDPATREAHFTELMKMINDTLTPAYAAAMFARTVTHLPTLLKNVKTFEAAGAAVFHDRRAADQVAVMLAGFYLCHSTREISFDDAVQWVRRRTWADHTAIELQSDELKLLARISLSQMRLTTSTGSKDLNIGELILIAQGRRDGPLSGGESENALARIGIKAKPLTDCFVIANQSPHLSRILAGTPWAHEWTRPLRSIEGASAVPPTYFAPGFTERGTSLPLSLLLETVPTSLQPPPAETYDGCSDEEIPL